MLSPKLQNPKNVETIVTACCTLHNLLIDMDPRAFHALADVEDPNTHDVRPGAWRQGLGMVPLNVTGGHNSHKDGKEVRQLLLWPRSRSGNPPVT